MELTSLLLIIIAILLIGITYGISKLYKSVEFMERFIFIEWMKWSGQDDGNLCEDCTCDE